MALLRQSAAVVSSDTGDDPAFSRREGKHGRGFDDALSGLVVVLRALDPTDVMEETRVEQPAPGRLVEPVNRFQLVEEVQCQTCHLVSVSDFVPASPGEGKYVFQLPSVGHGRTRKVSFRVLEDAVEGPGLHQHPAEGLREASALQGVHRRREIVAHAVVDHADSLLAEVEDGVAGTRISVVGPAHAAGVHERNATCLAGERHVGMAAEHDFRTGQSREAREALRARGGLESLRVGRGTSLREKELVPFHGELALAR